jgi:hypothetical protein
MGTRKPKDISRKVKIGYGYLHFVNLNCLVSKKKKEVNFPFL